MRSRMTTGAKAETALGTAEMATEMIAGTIAEITTGMKTDTITEMAQVKNMIAGQKQNKRTIGRLLMLLIVFLAAAVMPGCAVNDKEQMEIQLITKEELLKFIKENQDSETVDITVDDLEGVDIDGFVARWHFTKDNIAGLFLKTKLDTYLLEIEAKGQPTYIAQELVSVNSTDAEYREFKEKFIASVDNYFDHKGKVKSYLDRYHVYYNDLDGEEIWDYLYIGQTKYLDQFDTMKQGDPDNDSCYYEILLPVDSEGLTYVQGFYYNKNKKYFMVSDQYDPFFDMIKIFTAME